VSVASPATARAVTPASAGERAGGEQGGVVRRLEAAADVQRAAANPVIADGDIAAARDGVGGHARRIAAHEDVAAAGIGEAAQRRDHVGAVEVHSAHGRGVQRSRGDDPVELIDHAASEEEEVQHRHIAGQLNAGVRLDQRATGGAHRIHGDETVARNQRAARADLAACAGQRGEGVDLVGLINRDISARVSGERLGGDHPGALRNQASRLQVHVAGRAGVQGPGQQDVPHRVGFDDRAGDGAGELVDAGDGVQGDGARARVQRTAEFNAARAQGWHP
jgi:hypothetical protein